MDLSNNANAIKSTNPTTTNNINNNNGSCNKNGGKYIL